jgi:hypothetical protein
MLAKKSKPPEGPVYGLRDAVHSFPNWQKADPQAIGMSLAEIAAAHNGRLQPRVIVEQARNRSHPLHQHFNWDKDAAALAHWLDCARSITRAIIIVEEDAAEDAAPKRAWLSVDTRDGVAYHSISQILREDDLRYAAMARAERELRAFEIRYAGIKEILEFISAARRTLSARLAGRQAEGEQSSV